MSAAPAAVRRARRYDPGRRDRLVDTALDVIAERGVGAATHRAIARAADVPLGSLTYHFGSLTELLAAAFTRHVDAVAARLDERMRTAPDRTAALESLAEHLIGSQRDLVLAVELYVAAARDPALRAVRTGCRAAGAAWNAISTPEPRGRSTRWWRASSCTAPWPPAP